METFTRYKGRRYRVVAYLAFSEAQSARMAAGERVALVDCESWAGFVESPTELLGFSRLHRSRRRCMLDLAKIITADHTVTIEQRT